MSKVAVQNNKRLIGTSGANDDKLRFAADCDDWCTAGGCVTTLGAQEPGVNGTFSWTDAATTRVMFGLTWTNGQTQEICPEGYQCTNPPTKNIGESWTFGATANEPILELNNRPIKPWRAVNALFSISIVSTNANSMPSCSLSNNALFKNGRSIAA